jgi:Ca-activated chloride channel family protein
MDEAALNALNKMPIPAPSPDARERAIRAGVRAFAEARDTAAQPNQGPRRHRRPMTDWMHTVGSWIMGHRALLATAFAGLLLLPVASAVYLSTQNEIVLQASNPGEAPADTAILAGERDLTLSREGRRSDASTTSTPVVPAQNYEMKARTQAAAPTGAATRSMLRESPPVTRYTPYHGSGRDRFPAYSDNPVRAVAEAPVSTFSIDVDTASYAFVRRSLEAGRLPPEAAVRVEELINYFAYDYPRPEAGEAPFRPTVAVYPTPWNPDTKLVHIGIAGREVAAEAKPRANLVFLVDVSGSMNSPDKLPLVKTALRLLVNRLDPEDSVALVTYAGTAGTALEPTKVAEKTKILDAIDALGAGGSTAGASGLRRAYDLAEATYREDGVNRVILATDGDFNVGISDVGQLKDYIESKRRTGIFLSVLGFGVGNYNDELAQALAQNGNGTVAYIDSLREAQKVLVEEAGSALYPIAKDVKIQVEFNPAAVAEYRLIGYETRALRRPDFNDDKVDAGDIASGHRVTAIYEITPTDSPARLVDELRYQPSAPPAARAPADEYAFLKMRYKQPDGDTSTLITLPISTEQERPSVDGLSDDMRFAAAVAAFGQKLRHNPQLDGFGYDQVLDLAASARGEDRFGYRAEFLTLVRLAQSLSGTE